MAGNTSDKTTLGDFLIENRETIRTDLPVANTINALKVKRKL
jgi:hypothetical protein